MELACKAGLWSQGGLATGTFISAWTGADCTGFLCVTDRILDAADSVLDLAFDLFGLTL